MTEHCDLQRHREKDGKAIVALASGGVFHQKVPFGVGVITVDVDLLTTQPDKVFTIFGKPLHRRRKRILELLLFFY